MKYTPHEYQAYCIQRVVGAVRIFVGGAFVMGRPRAAGPEYCTKCGKEMYRPPSARVGRSRPFCCRACQMAYLNAEYNPKRMTPDVRQKLRIARLNSGEGKTYSKFLGRHTHRVVAELMLGRPLKPGEVVHHIDGDKRNNAPENLMVFENQAAHAKWHEERRGGDGDGV